MLGIPVHNLMVMFRLVATLGLQRSLSHIPSLLSYFFDICTICRNSIWTQRL